MWRESGGGGDRNRTDESRFCRPLPYRLATPPARVPGIVRWRKILPGGQVTVNQKPTRRSPGSGPGPKWNGPAPDTGPAHVLERETGVEPATSTLARLHST